MKSIRWIAAVVVVAALAGQAMSQGYSSTNPNSAQGSSSDQMDPGGANSGNLNTPNSPPSSTNTGNVDMGNPDTGGRNTGAISGADRSTTESGVTGTAVKCHWWSMSKECRDQRRFRRSMRRSAGGTSETRPSEAR